MVQIPNPQPSSIEELLMTVKVRRALSQAKLCVEPAMEKADNFMAVDAVLFPSLMTSNSRLRMHFMYHMIKWVYEKGPLTPEEIEAAQPVLNQMIEELERNMKAAS